MWGGRRRGGASQVRGGRQGSVGWFGEVREGVLGLGIGLGGLLWPDGRRRTPFGCVVWIGERVGCALLRVRVGGVSEERWR